MAIEWEKSRQLATESCAEFEVDDFERQHFNRFTREHRRFLTTITNGGGPVGDVPIPTLNCPGGAGALLAVYGINCPESFSDMGKALRVNARLLPQLIPFGYDQGSNEVFIDMMNNVGGVVFMPLWEMSAPAPQPYHAANSIEEFLEESARLALEFLEEDS